MAKSASKKKPAAALAAGDDESARGRLLNAATHLFCRYGINATGIDAIINEAGTAKTTLYKLFGSKTNLVNAVLESEGKAIFWKEKAGVERQLKRWPPGRLVTLADRLLSAERAIKSQASVGDILADAEMITIARAAQRGR